MCWSVASRNAGCTRMRRIASTCSTSPCVSGAMHNVCIRATESAVSMAGSRSVEQAHTVVSSCVDQRTRKEGKCNGCLRQGGVAFPPSFLTSSDALTSRPLAGHARTHTRHRPRRSARRAASCPGYRVLHRPSALASTFVRFRLLNSILCAPQALSESWSTGTTRRIVWRASYFGSSVNLTLLVPSGSAYTVARDSLGMRRAVLGLG